MRALHCEPATRCQGSGLPAQMPPQANPRSKPAQGSYLTQMAEAHAAARGTCPAASIGGFNSAFWMSFQVANMCALAALCWPCTRERPVADEACSSPQAASRFRQKDGDTDTDADKDQDMDTDTDIDADADHDMDAEAEARMKRMQD